MNLTYQMEITLRTLYKYETTVSNKKNQNSYQKLINKLEAKLNTSRMIIDLDSDSQSEEIINTIPKYSHNELYCEKWYNDEPNIKIQYIKIYNGMYLDFLNEYSFANFTQLNQNQNYSDKSIIKNYEDVKHIKFYHRNPKYLKKYKYGLFEWVKLDENGQKIVYILAENNFLYTYKNGYIGIGMYKNKFQMYTTMDELI
jgi:hypothetical protein